MSYNKFPVFVALRYLISKKNRNVINVITAISMGGIAVGAMALIVILSAFNGLERLVESLYSSFDPDIKITATVGKSFNHYDLNTAQILGMDGVVGGSFVLEETAVLKYNQKQTFASVKGIDSSFLEQPGLDSMLYQGEWLLQKNNINYAVLGYGIADKIGLYLENALQPIFIYAAKNTHQVSPNLVDAFVVKPVLPSGIFSINADFDNKYILVPLSFAQTLFDKPNACSAYEINLRKNANAEKIANEIKALIGNNFKVETKYQLNEIIYKTNKTEKWITFLILSFVLVLATFNLIGNLAMIIIDKRQDLFTLKSLGATEKTVFHIFFIEGVLISLIGGLGGILVGFILIILQQEVGLVPLQGVIVDYYPMAMEITDFIAVFFIVILIGALASYFPTKILSQRYFNKLVREV